MNNLHFVNCHTHLFQFLYEICASVNARFYIGYKIHVYTYIYKYVFICEKIYIHIYFFR